MARKPTDPSVVLCFSCYVRARRALTPATQCVRWLHYHWPLCDKHARLAARKSRSSVAARVVKIADCPEHGHGA